MRKTQTQRHREGQRQKDREAKGAHTVTHNSTHPVDALGVAKLLRELRANATCIVSNAHKDRLIRRNASEHTQAHRHTDTHRHTQTHT